MHKQWIPGFLFPHLPSLKYQATLDPPHYIGSKKIDERNYRAESKGHTTSFIFTELNIS